ncbi:hypothetical protein J2W32_006540 [Variovorax boronicumulans]|uniref:Uncharacterized protein n=1 Tax=Variovorax boronicumulans TaxID=436515 RepID=A0AAW8DDF8_9BURK|nr:hypothetical protein [Variovorax boronicumulans]MDP9897395.1 hypothetical protein [Variovorax boronicumulans]MDQ0057463.1 hypothetical protein [Variovorax boronicumulans]
MATFSLFKLGLLSDEPLPLWGSLVFALIVAFCVKVAVTAFSDAPTTYSEALYGCLANYTPVDKEGYLRLQVVTREKGHLDTAEVLSWAQTEQRAMDSANRDVAAAESTAKADFLGKGV